MIWGLIVNHNLFGRMHSSYSRRDFIKQLSALTVSAGVGSQFLTGCGSGPTGWEQSSILPAGEPTAMPFDPSAPWWLQGNFAPVDQEVSFFTQELRKKGQMLWF